MIASHAANKATFKVTTPSDRERGAGLSYDRLDDLVVELQQS